MPTDRVSSVIARAGPVFRRYQHEIAYVSRGTAVAHQFPGRIGVDSTIFKPDLIEHQIGSVGKLERKPIPTSLVRSKLVGRPFTIKPGQTGHLIVDSAHLKHTLGI